MGQTPKETIALLRKFSVPEMCDGMEAFSTMDCGIRPMVTQKKIVGPALTVQVPIGEGGFVCAALDIVKPGEVIVVAGGGNCRSSYWGDMRSICAEMAGAEGVVIDGAFRDIEGCEEVGFPIYFSRGPVAKLPLSSTPLT